MTGDHGVAVQSLGLALVHILIGIAWLVVYTGIVVRAGAVLRRPGVRAGRSCAVDEDHIVPHGHDPAAPVAPPALDFSTDGRTEPGRCRPAHAEQASGLSRSVRTACVGASTREWLRENGSGHNRRSAHRLGMVRQ